MPSMNLRGLRVPVCGFSNLRWASRHAAAPCARSLSSSRPPMQWRRSDAGRNPWLEKARNRLFCHYSDEEYFKPLKLQLRQIEKLHLQKIFVRPLLTDKPRDLETEGQYGKEGDRLSSFLPINKAKLYNIYDVFQGLESGVQRGKTVLILGPSGTGKTTCFGRMLPFWWGSRGYSPELLLLVRIRTHHNPGIAKEQTLRRLFRLDDLGLEEEEIQNMLKFISTRDNPNDVCIIVDGLDKCELYHSDLLYRIIERKQSGMHAYNLVITARPCPQLDKFRKEDCFNRELYLNGFSRKERDSFLKKYVSVRHGEEWSKVRAEHSHVLDTVDNFCDLVTRLPFITTLFGELLPDLKTTWKPESRTELFDKLIGHLIAQDLIDEEMHTIGDVWHLPRAHQRALQVIGELAFNDLFSDSPKRGFSAKQLQNKLENIGPLYMKDQVKQVRHALTETIFRQDGFQTEKFFLFLDTSVQEYLAAYAFSSMSGVLDIPHGRTTDKFETFWLFAAGHSRGKASLSGVFHKMMDYHSEPFKVPGVSEMVMGMLEEAFPCVSRDVQANHDFLLRGVSRFLEGHLYYGRRWAIEKRPFRCVGHAMQVLPNIEKVTVFSRSQPAHDAFVCFLNGLLCQRKSLIKAKLLSMHTKSDNQAEPDKLAGGLVSFLQEADRLEVFRCDWQFPEYSMQHLCQDGIAKCLMLWDVGLSLHSQMVSEEALEVFTAVVRRHPSLISVNIGDIGPVFPKPLAELITDEQCKVERLNILMNNASRKMIHSLLTAIQLNKSLTSIGLITSNHYLEDQHIDRLDRHQRHVAALARTIRRHPKINRVIIETATFSLDDSCFLAMFKELTRADTAAKTPIKFLKVVCNQDISEDAGQQFEQLVDQSQLKAVSTRRQLGKPREVDEVKGRFKKNIPAFFPRGHPMLTGAKTQAAGEPQKEQLQPTPEPVEQPGDKHQQQRQHPLVYPKPLPNLLSVILATAAGLILFLLADRHPSTPITNSHGSMNQSEVGENNTTQKSPMLDNNNKTGKEMEHSRPDLTEDNLGSEMFTPRIDVLFWLDFLVTGTLDALKELLSWKQEHCERDDGRDSSSSTPLVSDSAQPTLDQLPSSRPSLVHTKPTKLDEDDHRILFGSEEERAEVVYAAALRSPLLPALQPQLQFFIYVLQWEAILDELVGRNVFPSSHDIYQEIVKEGLSANKRRRLLFFYMLGSLPFSAFKGFWLALQAVHGLQDKSILSSIEKDMVTECRTFITKHCLSLEEPIASRVLHRLGVQTPQSSEYVTKSTDVEVFFLKWHEENTIATAFPHLLQAMVDEGIIHHPSTQLSRTSGHMTIQH